MKLKPTYILAASLLLIASWLLMGFANDDFESDTEEQNTRITVDTSTAPNNSVPSQLLASTFSDADLTKSLVDYNLVLSGGVAKDGIPALSSPKLDPLSASTAPSETLGILIEHNQEKRFYPYNILVRHEIVNDTIADLNFAATFCPLCGSAIVFDRSVDGEVKEFGVSGFLFESNLIMYDRSESPSLWSQARGEAIIGDQTGTKLGLIDFQLLTLDDVRNLHPDALILSTDTGFARSYDFDPYSGYEDTEDTIFEVSVDDQRYPAKEVFFIVPQDDESRSIAIRIDQLKRGQSAESSDLGLSIEKTEDGEIITINSDGLMQIGYYEMWFSWAQHHQEGGEVWDLSEI